MRPLILALLAIGLVISGCVIFQEEQNLTNETPPPPPPPPAPTPTVAVLTPMDGETILTLEETADVTLALSTQNLLLKPPGGAAKKGEGHFKITVDGGDPQTVSSKTYLISGLAIGQHTVRVELMNNDRTSYYPMIYKEVMFLIEKDKPLEYEPQAYTVTIQDFSYSPSSLTVKVGDTVTFVNQGNFPRSATCFMGSRQVFDTKVLAHGQNATIRMGEVMDCEYYSTTHKLMTGTISVGSNETG